MQPSAFADVAGRSDRVVRASGVLGSQSPELFLGADLRDIAGLGYAANRKNVTVRYPLLGPVKGNHYTQPFTERVDVGISVLFDGASEIRWTQNPSSGFSVSQGPSQSRNADSRHVDVATWDYRFSDIHDTPPPNITGTRESVSNRDTDRVFYAGVAFGTAGAGYMGAMQALFGWLSSRSDSDSRAPLKRRRMRLRDRDFWRKMARGGGATLRVKEV
jgi:hypothetical protein